MCKAFHRGWERRLSMSFYEAMMLLAQFLMLLLMLKKPHE